uniref:Uncharacterized protein n=1 Tax=Salix viminalis TaxID=40686 RepID=A0A6N2L9Y1_SALVM
MPITRLQILPRIRLVRPKRLYQEKCNMEETELRMLMMRRRSMRKRTEIWLQRVQVMRRTRNRKRCGMDKGKPPTSNIVSEKASKAGEAAAGRSNGGYGGDGERDAFDETKNKVEEAYVIEP